MAKGYRSPTEEGNKQIAMRFVYDRWSESDIREHYLGRGVNIGDLRGIVGNLRVINAVCLEKGTTYDIYEEKLRAA